jgi:hypothetical protein
MAKVGKFPTLVNVPCARGHEEPRGASSVDEDAGNVTLPCALRLFSGLEKRPENAMHGLTVL